MYAKYSMCINTKPYEACQEIYQQTNDMMNEKDIINYILDTGKPITASEMAVKFGVTKSEVNSMLYRMEKVWLMKSSSTPPLWSMRPIDDIVADCLSERPTTAIEIAARLYLSKSMVNSSLYRLESTIACHDDHKRPNWYLKESVD